MRSLVSVKHLFSFTGGTTAVGIVGFAFTLSHRFCDVALIGSVPLVLHVPLSGLTAFRYLAPALFLVDDSILTKVFLSIGAASESKR